MVNVHCSLSEGDPAILHRARVLAINDLYVDVEIGQHHICTVHITDIEERLKLPWQPASLRDHSIILRRRNASRDDYIEDLRVRRNIIRRLMHLFTKQRCWREGKGIEPLHQYYVGFDCMSDAEIDELYPEDDVPADLNMQEIVVDTSRKELTPE